MGVRQRLIPLVVALALSATSAAALVARSDDDVSVPGAGTTRAPRTDGTTEPSDRPTPDATVATPTTPTAAALPPPTDPNDRMNLVLILTDDQTVDQMRALPNVQRLLGRHGVTFTNSFAATPLCCPSRAGLLTGQYSSHHGVLDNTAPNGGVEAFRDDDTLATWLDDAGYRTSLVGKYLNDYEYLKEPRVPPGWDDWHAFMPRTEDAYYGYELQSNGDRVRYGAQPKDYLTDVLADRAVDFVRRPDPSPFFLMFAPFAPHFPAVPSPRDRDAFAEEPRYRPPNYNRAAFGTAANKLPTLPPYLRAMADSLRPNGLRTLLSVDRAVVRIVEALERMGELDNTVIAFTSDNGHLFGEHKIVNKTWAFEPSIRVPLVISAPWITAGRRDDNLVVNLDLTATFAALAGVRPGLKQDGRSLVPLLRGSNVRWRDEVRIEYLGDRTNEYFSPPYRAIRTHRYKLIAFLDGDRELYDLQNDPYELSNIADAAAAEELQRDLYDRLQGLIPPP